MGYMNKHHSDVLRSFAETFSELGKEKARRNAWSGGSYKIESAKLVDIDVNEMELEVTVYNEGKTKSGMCPGRFRCILYSHVD